MPGKYPSKRRNNNWAPGQSGNLKGRPAGVPDKVNIAMKKAMNIAFSDFIDDKFSEVQDIWKGLADKDKVSFYLALLPYVKPRLMAVKQETTIKNETGAEHLSDSELTEFILKIDHGQSPDSEYENDKDHLNPNNHGDSPI